MEQKRQLTSIIERLIKQDFIKLIQTAPPQYKIIEEGEKEYNRLLEENKSKIEKEALKNYQFKRGLELTEAQLMQISNSERDSAKALEFSKRANKISGWSMWAAIISAIAAVVAVGVSIYFSLRG